MKTTTTTTRIPRKEYHRIRKTTGYLALCCWCLCQPYSTIRNLVGSSVHRTSFTLFLCGAQTSVSPGIPNNIYSTFSSTCKNNSMKSKGLWMTQNVLTFGVVTAPELYMDYGEITRSRATIQQKINGFEIPNFSTDVIVR